MKFGIRVADYLLLLLRNMLIEKLQLSHREYYCTKWLLTTRK